MFRLRICALKNSDVNVFGMSHVRFDLAGVFIALETGTEQALSSLRSSAA